MRQQILDGVKAILETTGYDVVIYHGQENFFNIDRKDTLLALQYIGRSNSVDTEIGAGSALVMEYCLAIYVLATETLVASILDDIDNRLTGYMLPMGKITPTVNPQGLEEQFIMNHLGVSLYKTLWSVITFQEFLR